MALCRFSQARLALLNVKIEDTQDPYKAVSIANDYVYQKTSEKKEASESEGAANVHRMSLEMKLFLQVSAAISTTMLGVAAYGFHVSKSTQ